MRSALLVLLLAACTPQQVATWSTLLDLPADPADPAATAVARDAWCLHGPELVDLIGPEAVETMPPGPLPECPPAWWVDLGHGVWGPAHLLDIRACESGGDYGAVSPSGRYRGAYQFDQRTWDGYGPVGVDPAAAAPDVQDAAAVALYRARGAQPWPTCGRQ